ncbi:MAG: Ig domain-containing protein [Rheinheimera sp.]|nr:Ig domain-containing protein [Rheinheimera sp.]
MRPLPVITANQNGLLQFDFNDYIEDPEGSAISFAPQNQQGFSLSKSGLLSGTATALADVSLPLQVTDKAGAVLKTTATIKVNAAPALTGSSTASGKVNQSFALDLNTVITDTEKHRITLTAQGLPAGLSLNGAVISGTPTAAGSATVSITAIDELGARNQLSLNLQIAPEDKKGGGAVGFGLLALLAFVRRRRS